MRQNYGYSAEQKTLGIPFRTLPRKRKQLENSVLWNKIEANSHNSVPNPSAEEKTTQNFVPWNKNRNKLSECCSEPFPRKRKQLRTKQAAANFKNRFRIDDF
jgi:hypothetical protein